MAKYCPETQCKVLYLECLECKDKKCKSGSQQPSDQHIIKNLKEKEKNYED